MDKYGIFIISNNVYVREDGEDDNTSSDLRGVIEEAREIAREMNLSEIDDERFDDYAERMGIFNGELKYCARKYNDTSIVAVIEY